MRFSKLFPCLCLAVLNTVYAWAAETAGFMGGPIYTPDFESKQWRESEVKFPAAPKKENLVSFYVSPATTNLFFVDLESISVDPDNVVRYSLVIQTAGGANNTSYEGMRCETRERRLYALGRSDGSWTAARGKNWVKISDGDLNRQYAALFSDYFCPEGVIVASVKEAKRLLRSPGPQSIRYGVPGQ